ncbi:MAG: hypothetical protein JSV19_02895 [Phycisphaerales bacterium]|nr:MAG: hypothetical protein JSV19_02895 [Phycisphaerales bacterium]
MSAFPGLSFAAIVICGLILLPLGLVFLKVGLWPRRQGDAPHCRKCGYNLTGLESARCPECGTTLDKRTVVSGVRRRRPGLILAGIASLLPLLAGIVLAITDVNWYRLRPTTWVISDAQSSAAGTARKAWRELTRREKDGSLSVSHRHRLIEASLREQGTAAPGPCLNEFVDFLGRNYAAGRLSERQTQTFLQQGMRLSLHVRARVRAGCEIPYTVRTEMRVPYELFWQGMTGGDISIDGVPTGHQAGFDSRGSGTLLGSSGRRVSCDAPGKHTMTIAVHVGLYEGNFSEREASDLRYETDTSVEAAFEVLGPDAEDIVSVVDDSALKEEVTACITPRDFRTRSWGRSDRINLEGMVDIASAPVGVAFEVFARFGRREFSLGSIACKADGSHHSSGVNGTVTEPLGETFDLILRGSRDAAESSLDVFEFWEGEVIFEDVPVQLEPKPE